MAPEYNSEPWFAPSTYTFDEIQARELEEDSMVVYHMIRSPEGVYYWIDKSETGNYWLNQIQKEENCMAMAETCSKYIGYRYRGKFQEPDGKIYPCNSRMYPEHVLQDAIDRYSAEMTTIADAHRHCC